MAILYEDFLRHVRDEVVAAQAPAPGRKWRHGRSALAPPERGCPACESTDFVATNYLRILATAPEDSEPARALRQPARGICLPHLAMGLERVGSEGGAERLEALYLSAEEDLRADLREFIRKQDYRRRLEGFTNYEVNSWARAVYRLVGEPAPRRPPER